MPSPAPLLARLGEIALKAESSKGAKESMALDGTEAKFRIFDATWTMDPERFDRRTLRQTLSRYPHLVGATLAQIEFAIELRKTAATGTEDAWGPLLRACGVKFTSGSGIYGATSDCSLHPSLTVYAYRASNVASSSNTVRMGVRGAAGTCRLSIEKHRPAMLHFTLFGSYEDGDTDLVAQTATLHAITHEAAIPAIFQSASLTWNGYAAAVSSFELDFGNVVVPRDNLNYTNALESFVITDREPLVRIDPELTLISSQDWLEQLALGTEVALAWSLSQPAANGVLARTIAFSAPKCQISRLTHGERNGIATVGLEANVNGGAEPGDNDWTLTITGS